MIETISTKRVLGGTRKNIRITCDSCGFIVESRRYRFGSRKYRDMLRNQGWSIGFEHHCPSCNKKRILTAKCNRCGEIITSDVYSRKSKSLGEHRFKQMLREDGWKAGYRGQYTCPNCNVVTRAHHSTAGINRYRAIVSINGNCIAEVMIEQDQVIEFTILDPDDMPKSLPISYGEVSVGGRGGLLVLTGSKRYA